MTDTAIATHSEARRDLLIAITLAFTVFAIHAAIASMYESPKLFVKYNLAAAQLVRGELHDVRLMDFSPLYLQLAVLNHKLFAASGSTLAAFQWFQTGLVAAASAFLFVIFRKRFSVVLSLAGALAFSLEKHILVYERIFEPEICLLFLVLGSIATLQREGRLAAGIAGVFAALALAARPTFLLLFLAIPAYYRLRGARGRELGICSALFFIPVLLAYTLIALQANHATGDWSTPVMNPGTVFFEGNNALSKGTSAVYPPAVAISLDPTLNNPDVAHDQYRVVAQQEMGHVLSVREVNAFWTEKALNFIADHPARFVHLLGTKALRAFHDYRWHDVKAAALLDEQIPSIPAFFATLGGLAIVGLIIEAKRWRESVLFYAVIVAQLAVMLIFYVSARQQVALLPPLFYFALVSCEAIRPAHWRSALIIGVAAALTAVFCIPNDQIREREYFKEGGIRRKNQVAELKRLVGRAPPLARHRRTVAKGLAVTPWAIESALPGYVSQDHDSLLALAAAQIGDRKDRSFFHEFDRAVLELTDGDLAVANDRFNTLAELNRVAYRTYMQPSDPLFYLGRIAALRGEHSQAILLLNRALERSPGDAFVLAELVAIGENSDARSKLARYYSDLDAQFLLGSAYLVHGSPQKAVFALDVLNTAMPRIRRVMIYLAVALGQVGEIDRGAEIYQEAAAIREAPLVMSEGVGELMRRFSALHPDDRSIQLIATRTLFIHGYFRDALSILEGLESDSEEHLELRQRLKIAIEATQRGQVPAGRARIHF